MPKPGIDAWDVDSFHEIIMQVIDYLFKQDESEERDSSIIDLLWIYRQFMEKIR